MKNSKTFPFDEAGTYIDIEQPNAAGPSLSEHDVFEGDGMLYDAGMKPPWGWDYVFSFKAPSGNNVPTIEPEPVTETSIVASRIPESPLHPDLSSTPGTWRSPEPFAENLQHSRTEVEFSIARETDPKIIKSVQTRMRILARLRSAGFAFSQIYIPSQKLVMLRFGMDNETLQEKAEYMGLELLLKESFGGGYMKFTRKRIACFVHDDEHKHHGDSYFCPSDRIIIILRTLQSKEHWGCDINIEYLICNEDIAQAFAVHSRQEQKRLIRDAVWSGICDPTWEPPFRDLKNYLGARVGLYFGFVSFYARMLRGIALFSIPIYILYLSIRNEAVISGIRWIFGLTLVLWTTWFLERWKRRNAEINIEWGLNDYHDDTLDITRPQFVGELRYGFYSTGGFVPLDDLIEETGDKKCQLLSGEYSGNLALKELPKHPYQDPRNTRNAVFQSMVVTAICVFLVGSLLFLLLWFRNPIVEYFEATSASIIANAIPGALNAVVITISDPIWRWISLELTRRENHRTNQQFENSLILKRFSFQFVSNFSSLLYIAFIKPYFSSSSCRPSRFGNAPDCMMELEAQMTSLVVTKATIQQILEVGLPFVTTRCMQWFAQHDASPGGKANRERSNLAFTSSPAQNRYVLESKLVPYDSTVDDYAELVIQFGFLSLFGLAFPLAAVVNFINNLVEVRTDAFKILVTAQRTNADDAADIGAWYPILEFLGYVSVLTNSGLLIFTSNTMDHLFHTSSLIYKIVAFFVMEHCIVLLKLLTAYMVNDMPGHTLRLLARQEFDIARFFNEGWHDRYRGTSMLRVQERDVETCRKFVNQFDVVSTDSDSAIVA